MNIWKAILMGIIQGLTEFLPVSSSGHLVIAGILLNVNTEASPLFDVLLHVGTLAAVFTVFWQDVKSFFVELVRLIADVFRRIFHHKPLEMYTARKMVLMVIVASIPTAILGLLVQKFLQDIFMTSLIAVGLAELITAAILLYSKKLPRGKKNEEKMKYSDGVFIGIMQGVAVIPGISRSGSTVSAGIAAGLEPDFAFRFSFLVSIPAIIGAALLELFDITSADAANMGYYLVGMLFAAAVGYFALKWFRGLVKKNRFHYFGYYCLALGVLAIILGLVRL